MRVTTTIERGPVATTSTASRNSRDSHKTWTKQRGPVTRTLTPAEYWRLIEAIPDQHRLMIQTAIETGLRWGELIALRPRHLEHGRLTVSETIVEVPLRAASNGQRASGSA